MISYKTLSLTLTLLMLGFSSFGQSLTNKSKEELKSMKKEAVAIENYDLATKIKKELKTRKTIDEKITEKNTALETAVTAEDYGKAEQLKNEIEQLKTNKLKIEKLTQEKETALAIEDYDRLIAIDNEIKNLKNLRKPNDRPLSTEKEIDFLMDYYRSELTEFDKSGGKYAIFKGEQKQTLVKAFQDGINSYSGYKNRINTLTREEEMGIHQGFLMTLKISKDKNLKTLYRNYYLSKINKHPAYTYSEKVNLTLEYQEKNYNNIDPETPNYETIMNAKKSIIEKNKGYLSKINTLSVLDKQLINIYFDGFILSSSYPIDKDSVDRFFK